MREIWRPVLGFKYFEVSNRGNVRSLSRIIDRGRLWKGRPIKSKPSPSGHLSVRLCENGHHWKWVHRLVLEAFIGRCPDGMEGCHNNGNPQDNRLENLRWDTRSGNHADKWRHGTMAAGERSSKAKLTASQVRKIRELSSHGKRCVEIAKKFGVTDANISSILKYKTWRHVA